MRCPDYLLRRLAGAFAMAGLLALQGCDRGGDLPDLAAIEDVPTMKRTFFGFLRPIVVEENQRIRAQREEIETLQGRLAAAESLGWLERRRLRRLAEEYEVPWEPDSPATVLATLDRRVDIIPPDLALAQAAKESGWGRSRFALEGNNLFGQWCYEPGCGLVPSSRSAGEQHEVAAFDSVDQAIRRYMNNLNTHERYSTFREKRAELRASDRPLSGPALVPGLLGYSERGEVYLDELQAMMRQNRDLLDEVASG
jgi:Bax protein